MRAFTKALRVCLYIGLLAATLAAGQCSPIRAILQQADLTPIRTATPELSDPDRAYALLKTSLYGPFMESEIFERLETEILDPLWLDGAASVERRVYRIGHGGRTAEVEVVFVTPADTPNAPLILSQNFSGNRAVIAVDKASPLPGPPQDFGLLEPIFSYFFGRHIVEPPLKEIVARGYGFVAMHPPDYLPDRSGRGRAVLDEMFGNSATRPGALQVWASLTRGLAAELKAESPDRDLIAFGHSRYGKTALLAGVESQHIDAVIAHQSGTAGASLLRDGTGESLGDVQQFYPHWLSPSAQDYADTPRALPTDAHALLAKLAGTPVLLGNARRDVWSDPEGAYQAARWAAANTDQHFAAERLDDFRPGDDIAFWTRPGTHGVTDEDWKAFLAFLDAHLK